MKYNAMISRLLSYLRPYRKQLLLAVVALIFTSGAILGLGGALRYLVDSGLSKGDTHLLNQALMGFFAVVVLLAVASYFRVYHIMYVSEALVATLRRDAFQALLKLDAAFYEKHLSGDLVARISSDASILQQVMVSSISVAIRNIFLFIGGIAMLLITSAKLTAMVLLLLLLVIPPIIILGKKVRRYARATQDALGVLQARADESLSGMRTIQAMVAEDSEYQGFDERVSAVVNVAMKRVRSKSLLIALVILLVFGAIITVLWFGGHKVIDGQMTAGQLTAFIFYSIMVAGAMGALSEIITDVQRASGAISRIFELFDATSKVQETTSPQRLKSVSTASIYFDQVGFSYPARPDKAVLEDFTLEVKAGETVAIVGASGSGKSTLFQLLLRFYDVSTGQIRISDADIRNLTLNDLRTHIGIVPQEPMVFSTSIAENIRLGLIASDAEVTQALHAANAMEFVARLPEGLHTYVGERGVQLSGGQKQRLAIARAMLRNPAILLLDEATSALDSENEQLVHAALEHLMQGRTTLVIAHRLSTVQRADRIVMLHEGVIEAIGAHEVLLGLSERYHRYVSLQFGKQAA